MFGDYGVVILNVCGDMVLISLVLSDCKFFYELIEKLFVVVLGISLIRDVIRGGLVSVVNEIVDVVGLGVMFIEDVILLWKEVCGFCEILGFDLLYFVNEGILVVFVLVE